MFFKSKKKLETIYKFFDSYFLENMQNMKVKNIMEYKIPSVVYKRTRDELKLDSYEMNVLILNFFDYMQTVKYNRNLNIEMINKNTDVLWHNLILYTKEYLNFCINHIGFYIHHNPYVEESKLNNPKFLLSKYEDSIKCDENYKLLRNDYMKQKNINQSNSNTDDTSNTILTIIMLQNLIDYEDTLNTSTTQSNYNDVSNFNTSSSSSSSSYSNSSCSSSNNNNSSSNSSCSSSCSSSSCGS